MIFSAFAQTLRCPAQFALSAPSCPFRDEISELLSVSEPRSVPYLPAATGS
ncbi:MAG: hypothetical protein NHB15_18980 [Methanosarcina barkeri]|nr:hypothetical protein [Methanosarcina sp. ERenArc_MAG2]